MHQSSAQKIKDQNDAVFLAILAVVLILEIFLWWYGLVTAILGVLIAIFAYFQTRRQVWTVKPAIGFGILVIVGWAFLLGALEVWLQRLIYTIWFPNLIIYWSFLGFSGFFIVLLVSRSLPFSIVSTFFYLATEDCACFLWHGIPPQNWFMYFPQYFPQWFIALGDPLPFWPYLPTFYVLVWAITIPIIIVMWYKNLSN
ncbi:MAG: hypothetical protein HWN65_14940 [Candidatus Helarchaeota archaeon]|nr:hypothetical protein [Candidatus Helarchaeota archaeon]